MNKFVPALLGTVLLGLSLVFASCATPAKPADAAAEKAAPAQDAPAATEAAAQPVAATSASVAAVTLKASDKPWIMDSFERIDANGKILIGSHPTKGWSNLSDEGWGGWNSRSLALSSSTEHATEGSKSMLLTIKGKVGAKGLSGACLGLGWDNDGPTGKDVAPLLQKIAYVVVDYTWEVDAENTVANPYVAFNFHANGTDDYIDTKKSAIAAAEWFKVQPGTGTAVIKLTKTFTSKTTRLPQFALKVYAAFAGSDEAKADTAEVGKKLVGKLWLDNLRYADADGNILSLP